MLRHSAQSIFMISWLLQKGFLLINSSRTSGCETMHHKEKTRYIYMQSFYFNFLAKRCRNIIHILVDLCVPVMILSFISGGQ